MTHWFQLRLKKDLRCAKWWWRLLHPRQARAIDRWLKECEDEIHRRLA